MLALYCILAPLLAAVDQLTKFFVIKFCKPVDTVPIFKNIFHFTYCENRGAAFGILQNRFGLFFIITVAVLVFVTAYMIKKRPKSVCLTLSLSLLVGGALGNFIDRVFRGFVVDFLDFCLIHFPVFNIADCFVVIGAILLAFYVLFLDKEPKAKDDANE